MATVGVTGEAGLGSEAGHGVTCRAGGLYPRAETRGSRCSRPQRSTFNESRSLGRLRAAGGGQGEARQCGLGEWAKSEITCPFASSTKPSVQSQATWPDGRRTAGGPLGVTPALVSCERWRRTLRAWGAARSFIMHQVRTTLRTSGLVQLTVAGGFTACSLPDRTSLCRSACATPSVRQAQEMQRRQRRPS